MTDMTPLATGAGTGRPERIAVVGAGISGLTAAYVLGGHHEVTVLESEPRLGGHAHTHTVPTDTGDLRVDSGFIVHNDRTYPLLRRLFAELGVQARPTEMSMSIRDDSTGTEYAGGRGVKGFVARPRQLLDREFVGMLRSVRRFHALGRDAARRDLRPGQVAGVRLHGPLPVEPGPATAVLDRFRQRLQRG